VLQFGDKEGAVGYLVGEVNRGLEYMFIMMNAARFAVGMQGIAISDRAYQKAVSYAKDRVQSRPIDGSSNQAVKILEHPDVRRMLATMRALTEGARALSYVAAAHEDIAQHHAEQEIREMHQAIYEFLVPVVKGWSTELSVDVASLGVQVHGGMGYIEETGAAQYYRDARILTIYEGTTAIQANDLIGRKTVRDNGAAVKTLANEIGNTLQELEQRGRPETLDMLRSLTVGRTSLLSAVEYILRQATSDPNAVFAGSVLYLKLTGIVLCGWQMARALLVAVDKHGDDPTFYGAKIATAQHFAQHILPQAPALELSITTATSQYGVLAMTADQC